MEDFKTKYKKIVKRKEVKYSLDEWKQINIYRQSMMNNNISDRSTYDHLKSVVSEVSKKITALKENFKSCQQLL